MPTSRSRKCVWSDKKKGRIANWWQTYRIRNEWKTAIEEVEAHLGLQNQLRTEDIGRIVALRKPKKRWLVMLCDLARSSRAQQHQTHNTGSYKLTRSCTVIYMPTGWTVRGRIPEGKAMISSPKPSRPAPRPAQPPTERVPGFLPGDKSVLLSPQPDKEGNKLMFLSEWREFPSAPCLAGKKNLKTARVSMFFKSRASLTCFRASFLPGRATDLSARR